MTPRLFVSALANVRLDGVFNPYSDQCDVHDLPNAASARRKNLESYLTAVETLGTDTIWMGRDLGYRGGRRTGLALTDEAHLSDLRSVYPGANPMRATRGPAVAERTAAEIWSVLTVLRHPPLLWNVFPFHPHEDGDPFSNRRFRTGELSAVTELNHALVGWLRIRRIVSIGQDAGHYASEFGVKVDCIRHPSYGGVKEFRAGVGRLYSYAQVHTKNQASLF